MLDELTLTNFTVFENANFKFGEGLNVIVGANGTGKTHLLKVGYAVSSACVYPTSSTLDVALASISRLDSTFDEVVRRDLIGQFPANTLSDLVRRSKDLNKSIPEATVLATIKGADGRLEFTVDALTKNSLSLKQAPDIKKKGGEPVFIPAKEVLTLGWLLNYTRYGTLPEGENLDKLPIDKTYFHLLFKLSKTAPFGLPEPPISQILGMIKGIIGGEVEHEGNNFFLVPNNQPRMNMNMVAEGIRKFATVYKLLENGTLTPATPLFWDEPDTNFNPTLLKEMAAVLTELAKAGFQIILATHSLFLMKELHILAQQTHQPVQYFGLSAEPGGPTTVATADNLELLPNIVALDAELDQSDRFQHVLDQEDANRN